jgi:hypothetical protein
MKRAVAELTALLAKAGRGAGLPLGISEDLAAAAAWMDAEAVDLVAELLADDIGRAALAWLCDGLDQLACGAGKADAGPAAALGPALGAARGLGLRVAGDHLQRADRVPPPRSGPLKLGRAGWTALERQAARTYVPASEASRARGAGAGAIDND